MLGDLNHSEHRSNSNLIYRNKEKSKITLTRQKAAYLILAGFSLSPGRGFDLSVADFSILYIFIINFLIIGR